jgi:hypothetical protein
MFDNGFTQYDIVELCPEGESVQESVIIGHEKSFDDPAMKSEHPVRKLRNQKHSVGTFNDTVKNYSDSPSTSSFNDIKIKEEPQDDDPIDTFVPEIQIKEEPLEYEENEFGSFDPTDFLKVEPDDDYENPFRMGFARPPRVEDILPFGATFEPLKLKPNRKRLREKLDDTFNELKGHRKAHAGGLECDICGKKFSYYRSYRQHRIDHQFSSNEVMCAICQKMIKPAALDYHMNYKHSEERKLIT